MQSYPQPFVTVDIVLLTLEPRGLSAALLMRDREPHSGVWTLPGGWIHTDEDEDGLAAAARILRAKAGLESPYLEQFATFASRHRDPRGWSASIAYYALVPPEQIPASRRAAEKGAPSGGAPAGSPSLIWLRPVDAIRSLPFDHLEILRNAVDRVRSKTRYSSLPLHLMAPTFTLSELQTVYEQVLGASLDKRSFRRRIEELDVVEPAPGAPTTGAHRPAQRYRVKRRHGKGLAIAERNIGLKE